MTSDTAPDAYSGFGHLFIGGKWVGGAGEPIANINPYSGETILEVEAGSADDVNDAYTAAQEAQKGWAAMLPSARAAVMAKAADILQSRKEEVVTWLIREAGSTRLKANLEVGLVTGVLKEAVSLPHMVHGDIPPIDVPGKESRVYRKPVGVVALISPWNWPLQLTARTLAPALAVGNAVVVKPASDTPVTGGLIFAKLFEEAGLPPGVLSVVPGHGSDIGDAIITHDAPRVISFTGSTPVGRGIAETASRAGILKRLELELGGDGPLVVLDDADLDQAVEAAVWGKFLHQGQICMITNRLIVEDGIYDRFVDAYVEKVRSLKVGDPDDPDTFIGPIINASQTDGLKEKIAAAREDGLDLLLGGEIEGNVVPPHVYGDVPEGARLASEEIFGPLAPIQRARDEEDALRLANDTQYGLSSAVFTQDIGKGTRFARRIEAGMAHVNDQPVNDSPFNPFGGEKNSGIGRFNGRWAVDAFTTDQWVTIQHERRPYPFKVSDLG